ncbi:hypothetical protein [Trueperella pyogenes]
MNETDEYEQIRAIRLRMEKRLCEFLDRQVLVVCYARPDDSARLRQLADEIHEDATLLREITQRWCDRLAGEE